jgi:hypothetical protein
VLGLLALVEAVAGDLGVHVLGEVDLLERGACEREPAARLGHEGVVDGVQVGVEVLLELLEGDLGVVEDVLHEGGVVLGVLLAGDVGLEGVEEDVVVGVGVETGVVLAEGAHAGHEEVALRAVVVGDAEEVVVPELLDEDLGVLLGGLAEVLLGGRRVLGLGGARHLALHVLDAVALRDLVVLEVHVQLVRDGDDLLHGALEALRDVDQVEAVHLALDCLQLALLFVHVVYF